MLLAVDDGNQWQHPVLVQRVRTPLFLFPSRLSISMPFVACARARARAFTDVRSFDLSLINPARLSPSSLLVAFVNPARHYYVARASLPPSVRRLLSYPIDSPLRLMARVVNYMGRQYLGHRR